MLLQFRKKNDSKIFVYNFFIFTILVFTTAFYLQSADAFFPVGLMSGDPCYLGKPAAGTKCTGGAIFVGSLNPGATSAPSAKLDRYMTTPGGCGDIPSAQKTPGLKDPNGDIPSSDFTPTCTGTDTLVKYWNNGSANYKGIDGIQDYETTIGSDSGTGNKDLNYGSYNTIKIIGVTAAADGGSHAAARYCDKLDYGGYSDWFLPNRFELNLLYTQRNLIPGLDLAGSNGYSSWYWSSTEFNSDKAWAQNFAEQKLIPTGYQFGLKKNNVSTYKGSDAAVYVHLRCMRKF